MSMTDVSGPQAGGQAQFNILLQLLTKLVPIRKTAAVAIVTDRGGNLVAGTHTIPAVPAAAYRYIQNQDIAPLTLQFGAGGAKIVLNEAGVLGEGGGEWNTEKFLADNQIFTGEIILTSSIATAQFAAGDS